MVFLFHSTHMGSPSQLSAMEINRYVSIQTDARAKYFVNFKELLEWDILQHASWWLEQSILTHYKKRVYMHLLENRSHLPRLTLQKLRSTLIPWAQGTCGKNIFRCFTVQRKPVTRTKSQQISDNTFLSSVWETRRNWYAYLIITCNAETLIDRLQKVKQTNRYENDKWQKYVFHLAK
jgi:hypothetical protein